MFHKDLYKCTKLCRGLWQRFAQGQGTVKDIEQNLPARTPASFLQNRQKNLLLLERVMPDGICNLFTKGPLRSVFWTAQAHGPYGTDLGAYAPTGLRAHRPTRPRVYSPGMTWTEPGKEKMKRWKNEQMKK